MIILTGFGPFGKYSRNLSALVVNEFPIELAGLQIIKTIIPVSWRDSITNYKLTLSKLKSKPKAVILLGIHNNKTINIEVYGWNFMVGYDEEKKFKIRPIKFLFHPWFKTVLNINKIYAKLKDKIEIAVSHYPGFYLCNYIYFWALYLSSKQYPVIFIHIPSEGKVAEYVHKVKIILKTILKIHFNK